MGFRNPAKANIRAVLNDWVARATEIHIDVLAVMHTELAACNYYDAVLNASNVGRTIGLVAEQKTLLDIPYSHTGIWLSIRSGNGHVHDAVSKRSY